MVSAHSRIASALESFFICYSSRLGSICCIAIAINRPHDHITPVCYVLNSWQSRHHRSQVTSEGLNVTFAADVFRICLRPHTLMPLTALPLPTTAPHIHGMPSADTHANRHLDTRVRTLTCRVLFLVAMLHLSVIAKCCTLYLLERFWSDVDCTAYNTALHGKIGWMAPLGWVICHVCQCWQSSILLG